jgi:hypothetical protein
MCYKNCVTMRDKVANMNSDNTSQSTRDIEGVEKVN